MNADVPETEPEPDSETRGAKLLSEATAKDLVSELIERHAAAIIFIAPLPGGQFHLFAHGDGLYLMGAATMIANAMRSHLDNAARQRQLEE